MDNELKIYHIAQDGQAGELVDVSESPFLQGVLKGIELKEAGIDGKTIEQIREENGLLPH